MTASTGPTWAELVATGPSLSDNSEYVTNSAMAAHSRHRSAQQSHFACIGTCTGESGPASPPEVPRFQDTPSSGEHYGPMDKSSTETTSKRANDVPNTEQFPQAIVTRPEEP
jgi:hypothetical protein